MSTRQCSLFNLPVSQVLEKLFNDATKQMIDFQHGAIPHNLFEYERLTPYDRFLSAKHLYMSIDRNFGNFLYSLIRVSHPLMLVEFGTSFGISTIFLAAAVRDNGAGKVITTEFIAEKAEIARENLSNAGLLDCVEFRIGDAVKTLQEEFPALVDFVFLDGEKSMYLDIIKILEPKMKQGCLITSDNTDHEAVQPFLDYIREKNNGYISSPLFIPGGQKEHSGHEVSVRL